MRILLSEAGNPGTAVSFYRSYGPLTQLRCQIGQHTVSSWHEIQQYDAVFAIRPYTRAARDLIFTAKECGVPVVSDLDDDLFNVPPANPTYGLYQNPDIRRILVDCLQASDQVITSTPAIQVQLELAGVTSEVIPNGYDTRLPNANAKFRTGIRKIAVWRGSQTHAGDLLSVKDELNTVITNHRDWTFVFMGNCPYIEERENVVFRESSGIYEYMRFLYETEPAILFNPLERNDFNLCKSNIAWIEATHAHAICVAPDMEEWVRPGILNYENSFGETLDAAICMCERKDGVRKQRALVRKSREYIARHLHLENLNRQRMQVFDSMGVTA